MELKVYKDNIISTICALDTRIEIPVETEMLIPDYLPQVFKIVKTMVYPVILQKQINGGRLAIEGYMRVFIYYQSEEDQALCSTEQKVPFTRQLDIKQGDGFDVWVEVSGELQYINTRAVNMRRLEIRGAYNMEVKVYENMAQEVITALNGGGIEYKDKEFLTTRFITGREKQFVVEDKIEFDKEILSVLDTRCKANVHEIKLVSGKTVLKGEISATILYKIKDSTKIQKEHKILTFNQIIDVDAAEETLMCNAMVSPSGCTLTVSEGENGYNILVNCVASVKLYKNIVQMVVDDGFSTKYDADVSHKNIVVEKLVDSISVTLQTGVTDVLQDEKSEILDCIVVTNKPELIKESDRNIIRGKIIVSLICNNSLGEIESYDKVHEYVLPKTYSDINGRYDSVLKARCGEVKFQKNGGEASVEVGIVVSGIITEKTEKSVVENVICEKEYEQDEEDIALRVYYAQEGEEIFDIAKRYHASPKTIADLAKVDTDILLKDECLLIPMF